MSDPIREFQETCDRAQRLEDPTDQAIAYGQALAAIPALQRHLKESRQDAVRRMRGTGMTDVEIGEKLGLTWARVSAIARGVSYGGNDIRRRNRVAEQQEAPPTA